MAVVKTLGLGLLVLVATLPRTADAGPMDNRGYLRWMVIPPSGNVALTNLSVAAPAPPPVTPAPLVTTYQPPAVPQPVSVIQNGTGLFNWNAPTPASVAAITAPVTATYSASPGPYAAIAAAAAPAYTVDAAINFGTAPYREAGAMLTGTPQAWYNSPSVTQVYGGVPNPQQQADFSQAVLQRVEQTFQKSGIAVNLTTDTNAAAPHMLSVVSGAAYAQNPDAIGIADVGNNGFSLIDKISYAHSVDELEWAVAHNVAHELMHAFGGSHHDTTGQYLDAAVGSWQVLTDPNTVFSQAAVDDLKAKNFRGVGDGVYNYGQEVLYHQGGCQCSLCRGGTQLLHPVPEPATIALWGLGGLGVLVARRSRVRRVAG